MGGKRRGGRQRRKVRYHVPAAAVALNFQERFLRPTTWKRLEMDRRMDYSAMFTYLPYMCIPSSLPFFLLQRQTLHSKLKKYLKVKMLVKKVRALMCFSSPSLFLCPRVAESYADWLHGCFTFTFSLLLLSLLFLSIIIFFCPGAAVRGAHIAPGRRIDLRLLKANKCSLRWNANCVGVIVIQPECI